MTMTREEQIMDIAARYAINETDGQNNGKAASMRGVLLSAFRDGAKWSDSHPHWIPVEEELPPPHYEGANSTDFVLVFDGYDVMFGYYDFGQKNWHGEDYKEMMFDITHWMPIVPPRKEDKK